MNVGVLGGTFDPIHNGHLAIARYAEEKLDLQKVLFVPAHQSPLKHRPDISSVETRLEMVRLAIKGVEGFELSTIEIDRPAPSYTVDTLSALKKQLGRSVNLFFILGWDSLAEISQWKQPEKLIKLCKLAAVVRKTVDRVDLTELERTVPGIISMTVFLDMPPVNISSTEIRKRVGEGLSINGMVPDGVEEYIEKKKLYRKGT
jgi:nicotinate-nucleotide adenylyltransferase